MVLRRAAPTARPDGGNGVLPGRRHARPGVLAEHQHAAGSGSGNAAKPPSMAVLQLDYSISGRRHGQLRRADPERNEALLEWPGVSGLIHVVPRSGRRQWTAE